MRAAELAERFEVSTRTIQRDLLALQEAGVPIWAQPGPSGGYSLNVETTLPPLNFTPDEAVAIATALAATRAMPFPEAGHAALNKLMGVMAVASKETASEFAGRIRVMQGLGGSVEIFPEIIRRALLSSVTVDLIYRGAQGDTTRRIVEPAGLLVTQNGWYLVAWCRLRQAPRTFRLDRIEQARLTDEVVEMPSLDDMLRELPYDLAEPALR